MLIPITITSSSPSNPKLPSGLAKISHNEVVLVELQGSLEVECNQLNERDGKLVGKLKIDDLTVNQKKKLLLSIIYFIVSYNRANRACSLGTIS
jgi:chromosome transmission fidelity protein 8